MKRIAPDVQLIATTDATVIRREILRVSGMEVERIGSRAIPIFVSKYASKPFFFLLYDANISMMSLEKRQ